MRQAPAQASGIEAFVGEVSLPASGYAAVFGMMVFRSAGERFQLSTQVHIVKGMNISTFPTRGRVHVALRVRCAAWNGHTVPPAQNVNVCEYLTMRARERDSGSLGRSNRDGARSMSSPSL
jgi:hypothetical protein